MIRNAHTKMAADTFALVTFAFLVGMIVEVGISGLSLSQSFQSRLLAIPLNFLVARPYGLYRDKLFDLTGADARGRAARALADILAFATFMMPQYAAVLWWVGAAPAQILTACTTVAAMSLAIGRPYGLYMVFCRKVLDRILR